MENANYRGKLGEDFVASYLEDKGIEILARNYKTREGEIDIITEENGSVHFIEVKTRLQNSFAEPKEFVDVRKQQKIILASLSFLQEREWEADTAFDVYEVVCQRNTYFKVLQLKIHRNAFFIDEENCKGLNL